jgi:hypothetical protein
MASSDVVRHDGIPDQTARRIRLAALVQVAVIVVIGALTVYLSAQIADLSRQRVKLRRQLTDESTQLTSLQAQHDRLAKELDELATQKETLQKQIQALQDRNLALRADLTTNEAAVNILQATQPAATKRAFAVAEETPRVYIQVATVDNERIANGLRRSLEGAGFLVPRVERVPAVPRSAEVRYFRPVDQPDARRLWEIVKRTLPDVKLVLFDEGRKASVMRPHHMELWF